MFQQGLRVSMTGKRPRELQETEKAVETDTALPAMLMGCQGRVPGLTCEKTHCAHLYQLLLN